MNILTKTIRQSIRVLSDDYSFPVGPKIFAANHVFYDDIATLCLSIKENTYILCDKETKVTAEAIDRIFLFLNGVIFVDKVSVEGRKLSAEKMLKVLENGANLLIFPESAWNFSPNQIIRPFRAGIIDIAAKGYPIIPCGIDCVNNEYAVLFGEAIDVRDYPDKVEAYHALRGAMATLRYRIWETDHEPAYNLNDDYWFEYITSISKGKRIDLEFEEKHIYKSKESITLEEVLCEIFGLEYHTIATNYTEYKKIKKLVEYWTNYR
jgi:hypothetical protein